MSLFLLVRIMLETWNLVRELCYRLFSSVFSFVRWKVAINEYISVTDYASGIRLPDCSKLAINRKKDNDVTIFQHDVIDKFFWRYFVSLVKFSFWSSFMSISSLVMELLQFSFISDWPEIRKSETPPSEFCPISVDWDKLGITNLVRMSLMKCYWMLQNTRVTTFTVLSYKGKTKMGVTLPSSFPRLGLKYFFILFLMFLCNVIHKVSINMIVEHGNCEVHFCNNMVIRFFTHWVNLFFFISMRENSLQPRLCLAF